MHPIEKKIIMYQCRGLFTGDLVCECVPHFQNKNSRQATSKRRGVLSVCVGDVDDDDRQHCGVLNGDCMWVRRMGGTGVPDGGRSSRETAGCRNHSERVRMRARCLSCTCHKYTTKWFKVFHRYIHNDNFAIYFHYILISDLFQSLSKHRFTVSFHHRLLCIFIYD